MTQTTTFSQLLAEAIRVTERFINLCENEIHHMCYGDVLDETKRIHWDYRRIGFDLQSSTGRTETQKVIAVHAILTLRRFASDVCFEHLDADMLTNYLRDQTFILFALQKDLDNTPTDQL